jgi:MFS family permease
MPASGGTFLTPAEIGIAYFCYFLVSALLSTPSGRLVEQIGSARSAALLCAVSTMGLGALAVTTASTQVIILVAFTGIANALLQPTVSSRLVAASQSERIPLTIGIVMAGVPLAALLSGLAGQLLDGVLGSTALLAIVALLVAGLGLSFLLERRQRGDAAARAAPLALTKIPIAIRPILIAVFLGSLGANSLPAFVTLSAGTYGVSATAVAAVLPFAVGLCVATRISAGGWLTRSPHRLRATMSLLLLLGGAGFFLMAFPATFLPGLILAYGAGWGWVGVANAYAGISHPQHAAVVTSWLQVGIFSGSALGPLAFGTTVTLFNPSIAWLAVGACGLSGFFVLLRPFWPKREA